MLLPRTGERRCSWSAGNWLFGLGRVERRSAAGEWLLWRFLGGGPPHFWKVPGRTCGGSCLAGRFLRPPGKGLFYAASGVCLPLSMMICSVSEAV
jgi:hypothetical protein